MNLIELVFESIPGASVDGFSRCVAGESSVRSVWASEIGDLSPEEWDWRPSSFLNLTPPATITINLEEIRCASLRIVAPLMQVIRCGDDFDVSVSFSDKDVSSNGAGSLISALHARSLELLRLSGGTGVFCGYEPASDKATRFFTNMEVGPLHEFWS